MLVLEKMKQESAIAVVVNFKYARKHLTKFINQLRKKGDYKGDVLVITDYFTPLFFFKILKSDEQIIVKRFKRIKFSHKTKKSLKGLNNFDQPNRYLTKKFQWHKLNLFDINLKKWSFIFYLDVNMQIHYDINPILELSKRGKFLARADGYPHFERTLSSQFDQTSKLYSALITKYDLEIRNFFQTGLMFFDTEIISNETKKNIINICEEYPISITNEQGILNLYFIHQQNIYEELTHKIDDYETYFYWLKEGEKIIITKQNVKQYK